MKLGNSGQIAAKMADKRKDANIKASDDTKALASASLKSTLASRHWVAMITSE